VQCSSLLLVVSPGRLLVLALGVLRSGHFLYVVGSMPLFGWLPITCDLPPPCAQCRSQPCNRGVPHGVPPLATFQNVAPPPPSSVLQVAVEEQPAAGVVLCGQGARARLLPGGRAHGEGVFLEVRGVRQEIIYSRVLWSALQ